MRQSIQLVTLFTALMATTAHAQISDPNKLVAPPPPNPASHHTENVPVDAQWLWQYTRPAPNGDKHGLLKDPRFHALLKASLRAPQSMWGNNIPLHEAAFRFLQDPAEEPGYTGLELGTVTANANRYITITGCSLPDILDGIPACSERGMLFVDLGKRVPLLVFAALRWNEQSRGANEPGAPYTLWIFPSQTLDVGSLPVEVEHSLTAFSATAGKNLTVTTSLLIDPNGTAHKLDPAVLNLSTNTKEATR